MKVVPFFEVSGAIRPATQRHTSAEGIPNFITFFAVLTYFVTTKLCNQIIIKYFNEC